MVVACDSVTRIGDESQRSLAIAFSWRIISRRPGQSISIVFADVTDRSKKLVAEAADFRVAGPIMRACARADARGARAMLKYEITRYASVVCRMVAAAAAAEEEMHGRRAEGQAAGVEEEAEARFVVAAT